VRSAIRSISDATLIEVTTALVGAEIDDIESQEDAGIFGGSRSAAVTQRIR
jgi:hypothetical protein